MVLLGLAGFIALKTTASEMADGFFSVFGFSNMNVGTIVYALVFFLLGYFLFATLAALLGSLVSRTEDVQQMIMPMTLLIVAAFMIAATGLGNPEMAYLKYASFFPFFAPLVMFLRVGMLDLPVMGAVIVNCDHARDDFHPWLGSAHAFTVAAFSCTDRHVH